MITNEHLFLQSIHSECYVAFDQDQSLLNEMFIVQKKQKKKQIPREIKKKKKKKMLSLLSKIELKTKFVDFQYLLFNNSLGLN